MIRTRVGRVISVIRSNDQQVVLLKQRQEFSQLYIKLLQLPGISCDITPMPPQSVEVHQINEAQPLKIPACDLNSLLHTVHGTFGLVGFRQALAVKDIKDLSHGDYIQTGVLQGI